ncbi:hypothetical protein C922_05274 [Plasmodium inui San Antonio 1]|uniref:Tryptophan/threonine-rich plasmodium antigen C-terminal domain-containing protein n=1 Tax=Plasmodium inui San Antonio 1 TaxID=1237626 RepID=W6ZYF9_9APIC|nr:hypothetical protein C922_05274 [Plasmodium inui San Antonio 1]EUD64335.1 hypothetical protein C922_05274 [Plasmodium inui San Antonio 1]
MDLKKYNNTLTSQRSPSRTTSTRRYKSAPKKSTSILSRLSILIFALSCAVLVNTASGAAANRRNTYSFVSPILIGFGELTVEESEEFKRMAWNNWMIRLECSWKHFHESVQEDKTKWLQERESAWSDWLRSLESTWSPYSGKMVTEQKINDMEESDTWNDRQWGNWIKTEGKRILGAQCEKWIKEADNQLQKLILDKWVQWRNGKIRSWLSSEWKTEEDYYWANIESASTAKWLREAEQNHWLRWKERINRESQQWMNWVQMKESAYIKEEWKKWSQWKNDKKILFDKWSTNLVYKWIQRKQWNVWIKEANNRNQD